MPKRTDISSILVIGAGPIVIGQACEFDYSGTQAIKALQARRAIAIVLVNSNPATIMTDPDMADATYVEPITPEIVAKIIEKERPDAVLPTMGGQTALNTALALFNDGTLEKYGVHDDRRRCRGDRQGRGPPEIPRGDGQDRARKRALGRRAHASRRRWRCSSAPGCPRSSARASRMGGTGGGIAYNQRRVRSDRAQRARCLADHRGADRGIAARLEGI